MLDANDVDWFENPDLSLAFIRETSTKILAGSIVGAALCRDWPAAIRFIAA
jgi:hypothetical protein